MSDDGRNATHTTALTENAQPTENGNAAFLVYVCLLALLEIMPDRK